MTVPVVTAFPPAPSRGDAPDLFETRMDAFLAALGARVSEMNAVSAYLTDALQVVPMAQETLALVGPYTTRHQGAWPTHPTTRNGGAALQAGDMYFSTGNGLTYAWSGSAWQPFTPSGRFKVVTLGEAQAADYTSSVGESVQLEKTSAALRVLFPASPVAGDLVRVVNATTRLNHMINGNGKPVAGSSIDIEFSISRAGVTFEYVGTAGWRAI